MESVLTDAMSLYVYGFGLALVQQAHLGVKKKRAHFELRIGREATMTTNGHPKPRTERLSPEGEEWLQDLQVCCPSLVLNLPWHS